MSWRPHLLPVLVGALGYFVDIFDLIIFSIVRVQSFTELGVSSEAMLDAGVRVANLQLVGLLCGGIVWGLVADRKGRLSVLFGSIILYSTATLANAFVRDIEMYGWLRFIAGVGLAGELGAAVTLVCESLPPSRRGYATAIVAACGILGGIVASSVAQLFSWRYVYGIGAVLGFALLFLRVRVHDSGMFQRLEAGERTQWGLLLRRPGLWWRYSACVAVGVPIWFVLGVIVAFGPEITANLGAAASVTVAGAVFWQYLGGSLGDLGTGLLSQWTKSRRRVAVWGILGTLGLVGVFLLSTGAPVGWFYALYFALGLTSGYWAIMLTIAAEQFGTNVRGTVATTVPNFVRATAVLETMALTALRPHWGLQTTLFVIAIGAGALALIGVLILPETFGKDLDYVEV